MPRGGHQGHLIISGKLERQELKAQINGIKLRKGMGEKDTG